MDTLLLRFEIYTPTHKHACAYANISDCVVLYRLIVIDMEQEFGCDIGWSHMLL